MQQKYVLFDKPLFQEACIVQKKKINFLFNHLMEKSSKGQKPVKLPKILFESWAIILDGYCQTNPKNKLISPVSSLKKLISLDDASWDKQAACIKESGKNNNNKKRTSSQYCQFL